MDHDRTGVTRRDFVKRVAVAGAGAALAIAPWSLAVAAKGAVTLADVGVGDPGGDWSRFTAATDWNVKLVAMGNAPSAVLNVLIAGGGAQVYDIVNIVGGMQKPLVENKLIEPLDTARLANWGKDAYIRDFLAPGKPGFDFIGYQGKVYGVPTVLQGDSFAFLPAKTGPLESYAAMFDPKWKGFVALEDNFTTTGQKTALYMQKAKLASIKDPANMTPSEIKTVIDFLIEKKKAGQFRVIWSSFEQAVNLLTSQEVYVIDCWEPMVFAAKKKSVNAVYAAPKEGYLLWAMAAYVVRNPKRSPEQTAAAYALLDFMLGGWYGAKITLLRGYMTNPQAGPYAKANQKDFSAKEAEEVAAIESNVRKKFRAGGTWQNRWPTHVEVYESEWARFKAA